MKTIEDIIDLDEEEDFYVAQSFNKKTTQNNNLFWLGFIIYTLAYTLAITTTVSFKICQALQLIGILLFIPNAFRLIKFKFDNTYLQILFVLYCIWILFIIFRGFAFDYKFLKKMFFDAYEGMLLYFVPLVLLFPKDLATYKKIFNVIFIIGVFYILYDIMFIKVLLERDYSANTLNQMIIEIFTKTLSLPCGFLMLTYVYHSKKINYLAIIVIIGTLLLAVIRARRALIFMCICMVVFTVIIYFYENKGKVLNLMIFLILISFTTMGAYSVFNANKKGLFSFIVERGDEDTRTGVEECLYREMDTNDWILGRGINGQYYCPGIIESDAQNYRSGIESDYLNIILKGGIVSLGLLLLIAIPAIFKGIFNSKNVLSKAAAIWILLYVMDLYPAPVTKFTLNYLLVWFSIGICYSKEIRNMPESRMKDIFLTLTSSSSR